MTEYIRDAVTLLAVINPLICGVMLLQGEAGLPNKTKILAATKTALAVFIILILSAMLGQYILSSFGISMDVFQIVGGIIIAYIGFTMFSPAPQKDSSDQSGQKTISKIVMFAASPGTIATVIALSAQHKSSGLPIIVMGGVGIAVLITWIIMLVMIQASGKVKKGGQQIFTRFMGLILISMGLQFVLTGLKEFMAS